MSQQGLLQQSIRDITGTELDYNGDWLALMASDSITTGTFNERLLAWINVTLGTSYTNLPEAQQAFAVDQGYTSWSHMGAIVLAVSLAATLADGETQALALDFTDDFWQADTGHYGSAFVLDTGTPANDYDSHPYGLLTYTSPSAKMTLGPSGTLRFGAHNLYVNSASPANQSITVVSGATYSVDITGSVSVTASGAATGTWTAGSNTFTAATTTLTLGSTSGSGTVVCRRTPSDSTYLATAGAARYALPFEWDSAGNLLGILVEEARTNLSTYSEQFDNAAWAGPYSQNKSITANSTAAPDGQTTADTFTATGADARINNSTSVNNTTMTFSVWVKRKTGTGAVYLYTNIEEGGTKSSDLSGSINSSTWTRIDRTALTRSAGAGTAHFVIEMATSGDEIYVWGAQYEAGAFATSYCPTISATASRAADNISLATTAFPYSATAWTLFARSSHVNFGGANTDATVVVLGNSSNQADDCLIRFAGASKVHQTFGSNAGAANQWVIAGGTNTSAVTTAYNMAVAYSSNDVEFVVDGASIGTDSGASAGTATRLGVGADVAASTRILNGYTKKLMYLPRRMSNGDMQTLTSA